MEITVFQCLAVPNREIYISFLETLPQTDDDGDDDDDDDDLGGSHLTMHRTIGLKDCTNHNHNPNHSPLVH